MNNDIYEIYNRYINENISMKNLGKEYNISPAYICKKFKQYKLKSRKRIYSLDENKFSNYNEESSYWAGFIAADGCVYRNKLEIGINNKDEIHLKKFCDFLNYKKPIEYKNQSVRIIVGSKKIVEDLRNNFNIIERKSLILQPPNNLNRHFIRGYLDGDGCICFTNRLELSIIGTYELLNCFLNFLNCELNIHKTKIYKIKNIYRIVYVSKKALSILNFLYKESNIYLDRKRNKYLYIRELMEAR